MNYRGVIPAFLSLVLTAGIAQAQNYQNYQGPPPQGGYVQGGGWDAPPPEFQAMRQRGFRDGIEGARRDFENHRPPNVNNRDEFRNPHFIPPPDRREYRFGFRRGYDVGVKHIYGPGPGPRGPRPY
jgi:hypothetical protein